MASSAVGGVPAAQSYVNFLRLLSRTEKAAAKGVAPHDRVLFATAVESLQERLDFFTSNDVPVQLPHPKLQGEYQRKIDFLKSVMQMMAQRPSPIHATPTLARVTHNPALTQEEKTRELEIGRLSRQGAEQADRADLLDAASPHPGMSDTAASVASTSPPTQLGLRRRRTLLLGTAEGSSAGADDVSTGTGDGMTAEVIEDERKTQDALADDLLHLASALKQQSLQQQRIVKSDTSTLDDMTTAMEGAVNAVKSENTRAEAQYLVSWNNTCISWAVLLLSSILFLTVIVILRIT